MLAPIPPPLPMPRYDFSESALDALDLDGWRRQWGHIGHLESDRPWAYGDLFNAGRKFVPKAAGKIDDDETLNQVATLVPMLGECGLTLRSLKILGHVARAFPKKVRRPALSWTHHREVWATGVPPGEQRKWLDKAEKQNWSVRDLRVAMAPESRPEPMETGPVKFVARRWADQGVMGLRELFPPDQKPNPNLVVSVRRELAGLFDELERLELLPA